MTDKKDDSKKYVHPDSKVTVEVAPEDAERYVSQGWVEKTDESKK